MADDETIVIRVNAAQGEAALKALGSAGIQAGKDIETVGSSTASSTDKLAAFGAKLFGLTKIAGTFGEVIRQVGNNIAFESDAAKEATTSTADLFTAIGSLDAPGVGAALGRIIGNLEAMREGLDDNTVSLGNAALGNAKLRESLRDVLGVASDLTAEHEKATKALETRAGAVQKLIAEQEKSGKVDDYLKKLLTDLINEYERSDRVVPPALAAQAASLNIVSTAQEKVKATALEAFKAQEEGIDKIRAALDGDSAARTENTARLVEAIARVEQHGAVTLETSAKIKAAIGEELDLYKSYGDAVPASLQAVADRYNVIAKSQQVVIDNAQKIIADIDAAAVKANQAQQDQGNAGVAANAANAEQLKQQIKAIEDSPIITLEQQNNLDNLKNQLLDNTRAASDLNDVFTVTADNYLTDEEALAKYNAELAIAQEEQAKLTQWKNQAQDTEKELAKARGDNLEALNQMEDAAGDAGGTFQDLGKSIGKAADAAGSLGDESKKGAEKGKEGLDKLNEGFTQAIPLAEQLRGILQEIVTLGAQADI